MVSLVKYRVIGCGDSQTLSYTFSCSCMVVYLVSSVVVVGC